MERTSSLRELVDRFVNHKVRIGVYRLETARATKSDLRGFLAFLRNMGLPETLESLATPVLVEFIDALHDAGRSGNTIKRKGSSLNQFGEWLQLMKVVAENPFTGVEMGYLHRNRRSFRFQDNGVAREFLRVKVKTRFPPEVQSVIRTLLLFAAPRTSEIRKLRWKHVDLEAGVIYIFDTKFTRNKGTSNGLDRRLPIAAPLKEALLSLKAAYPHEPTDPVIWHRRGQPTGEEAYYGFINRITSALGLEQFVPHLFRHNLASNLTSLGAGEDSIALLLGHKWVLNEQGKPVTTGTYVVGSGKILASYLEKYAAQVVSGCATETKSAPGEEADSEMNSALSAPADAPQECGPRESIASPLRGSGDSGDPASKPQPPAPIWSDLPPALVGVTTALWRKLYPTRPLSDPGFAEFIQAFVSASD